MSLLQITFILTALTQSFIWGYDFYEVTSHPENYPDQYEVVSYEVNFKKEIEIEPDSIGYRVELLDKKNNIVTKDVSKEEYDSLKNGDVVKRTEMKDRPLVVVLLKCAGVLIGALILCGIFSPKRKFDLFDIKPNKPN